MKIILYHANDCLVSHVVCASFFSFFSKVPCNTLAIFLIDSGLSGAEVGIQRKDNRVDLMQLHISM